MNTEDRIRDILAELSLFEGALPLSYSRMDACLLCRRRFDLQYRKRILSSSPKHIDTHIGTEEHALLQECVLNAARSGDFTVGGAGFDAHYNHLLFLQEDERIKKCLTEIRGSVRESLETVLGLAKKAEIVKPERDIRLSKWLLPVRNFSKYAVVGKIDLELCFGSHAAIFDYKTEEPSKNRDELVKKQLALYAFLEFLYSSSISSIDTYCVYLKTGEMYSTGSYKKAEREELLQTVLRMFSCYKESVALVEGGDVRPSVNWTCTYCEYREDCSAWQEEKRCRNSQIRG